MQTHYPLNNNIAPVEANTQAWPEGLWRMFLKHLLSVIPMKRYLNRFSHDLVIYRPHEERSAVYNGMETMMEPMMEPINRVID